MQRDSREPAYSQALPLSAKEHPLPAGPRKRLTSGWPVPWPQVPGAVGLTWPSRVLRQRC